MPIGEFVIGRSSSCSLALDDALVSRRHAVLHTTPDRVDLEDLGSRNGVTVNGSKVAGTKRVSHLDRITIGGHELVLVEVARSERPPRDTSMLMRCQTCSQLLDATAAFCSGCGAALGAKNLTLPGATMDLKLSDLPPAPQLAAEGLGSGFTLLASIADKSLALSRFAEAERMLLPHLDKAMQGAAAGKPVDQTALTKSAGYALKLARGLESGVWLDWFFQFHAAVRQLPSAETVDELHDLARAIGYRDPRALRAYLEEIRAVRDDLTPTERFVLSRLESLVRVVSA